MDHLPTIESGKVNALRSRHAIITLPLTNDILGWRHGRIVEIDFP
jgi:hypothetical protein